MLTQYRGILKGGGGGSGGIFFKKDPLDTPLDLPLQ